AQMGWVAAVSLLMGENFVMRQAADLRQVMELFIRQPLAIYARGPNSSLAAAYAAYQTRAKFVFRDGFASYRQFFERPRSLAQSFRLQKEDKDRTIAFDREIPFA